MGRDEVGIGSPVGLLVIEGWRAPIRKRRRRKGNRNRKGAVVRAQILNWLPLTSTSNSRWNQRDIWGGAGARGAVKKSGGERVIKRDVDGGIDPTGEGVTRWIWKRKRIPRRVVSIKVTEDKGKGRRREVGRVERESASFSLRGTDGGTVKVKKGKRGGGRDVDRDREKVRVGVRVRESGDRVDRVG